ncbi:MAG: hypothetical protein WC023_07210 [Rhodocyclaceae bacterium]
MNRPLLKLFVAVVASLLAPLSIAVEFGPLQLRSTLGEPLVAELDVRAQSGDVLNPKCIKVFVPSGNYPPLVTSVEISWQSAATGQSLLVRSAEPLAEPAMRFALEANCGAGRSWQEFAVLLHPAARVALPVHGEEWLLAPGETPLSLAQLLYPGQRGTQRRFIAALAAANPELAIDDSGAPTLAAGTPLQMPDWRALAGAGKVARSAPGRVLEAPEAREALASQPKVVAVRREGDEPPAAAAPMRPPAQRVREAHRDHGALMAAPLRLSMVLAPRRDANEQLRQMLRLEYRLLMSLNEQLSALHAGPLPREASVAVPADEPPVRLQSAAKLPAASALADTAAPATSPAALPATPPVAVPTVVDAPLPPVKIPQAPPAIVPEASEDVSGWVYYAGLGAGALVLLAFLRRRRDLAPPQDFVVAETVVMDAAPASTGEMEALFAAPEAQPAQLAQMAKAVSLPPPVDKGDPNPVMELAEIMLSFGRIQGAAQTLQEYIEANPNEALQPWFKLLEVYRVGDMHAEFDTLAQQLNRNFNVELQQWDTEAPAALPATAAPAVPVDSEQQSKALSLEEIPHIWERLVACWGKPECLDFLHQLLRDNRGGQRSGFTLPVVQEILLLIDILVAKSASGSK